MQHFPANESQFLLAGPAGSLEVWTTPSPESSQQNTVAIICHPHPQQEGTMQNKVVTTLAKTMQNVGLATVRFNFRGIGKSTGTYGDKAGELQDALAIIQWVQQVLPQSAIWLAGFSFGAYIATLASLQIDCRQLITVALPVTWFEEAHPPRVTCPWILVQGDQDDIVKADDVNRWIQSLPIQPRIIHLKEAGHFFHGQLVVLREALEKGLNNL